MVATNVGKRTMDEARAIVARMEAREDALTALAAKSMSEGNLPAAAETYRELVALNPNSADLRNNFGILLARAGDLTGAIAQFEAALRIQPSHEAARRNLERLRNRP